MRFSFSRKHRWLVDHEVSLYVVKTLISFEQALTYGWFFLDQLAVTFRNNEKRKMIGIVTQIFALIDRSAVRLWVNCRLDRMPVGDHVYQDG